MSYNKLQIVNDMLSCIGDTPVDSLTIGDIDVDRASRLLDRISINIQNKGWWFNMQTVPLTNSTDPVTGTLQVEIPANTLYIRSTTYTQRGDRLYDIPNNTFTIDLDGETLDLPVYLLIGYDDLPDSMLSYLSSLACLQFFLQEDGDPTQVQFLGRNVSDALATVQDEDLKFKNPNLLNTNPTVSTWMGKLTRQRR